MIGDGWAGFTVAIPRGFAGALGFAPSKWSQMLTVLIPFYVLGWQVGNDVYILPESRDGLLMIGHHGELTGSFPNEPALHRFTAAMAAKGFHLPDHIPDPTFKRPAWMAQRGTA